MTSRDAVESLDDQEIEFGSLSERLIYLYLRFHADKRGVVRLSMAELAAQLRVNRQTVVKHVDALKERRLVTRQGHGRYRVHAAPWSLRDAARSYRDTLQEGDEWDSFAFAEIAFGEKFNADSKDPRLDEALEYCIGLERAGLLHHDEMTGTVTVARRKTA